MIYKIFETERLILRPVGLGDAEFILKLLNSPSWLKYIGDRNVSSISDAKKYIQTRMLPQLERLGFGNYLVIRKGDESQMGCCGLYDRDGLEGVDIGFAFLANYVGKGYAYEAAVRIKQAAFEDFGLEIINGITTKDNHASQKLLDRLGLKQIGTTQIPNEEEILLLYQVRKK